MWMTINVLVLILLSLFGVWETKSHCTSSWFLAGGTQVIQSRIQEVFNQKPSFFSLVLTTYSFFSFMAKFPLYKRTGQLHPFAFLIVIDPCPFFCYHMCRVECPPKLLSPLVNRLFISLLHDCCQHFLNASVPGDSLPLWEKRQEEEN